MTDEWYQKAAALHEENEAIKTQVDKLRKQIREFLEGKAPEGDMNILVAQSPGERLRARVSILAVRYMRDLLEEAIANLQRLTEPVKGSPEEKALDEYKYAVESTRAIAFPEEERTPPPSWNEGRTQKAEATEWFWDRPSGRAHVHAERPKRVPALVFATKAERDAAYDLLTIPFKHGKVWLVAERDGESVDILGTYSSLEKARDAQANNITDDQQEFMDEHDAKTMDEAIEKWKQEGDGSFDCFIIEQEIQ